MQERNENITTTWAESIQKVARNQGRMAGKSSKEIRKKYVRKVACKEGKKYAK